MSNDSGFHDFPESSGSTDSIGSSSNSLSFKKRARRRLVGAVVFAGLAAVILPMVMDEEPKQIQNVQIRIPDPDQVPPFRPRLDPETRVASERPVEFASPVVEPLRPETPKHTETPKPSPKPADPPKPAPKPVDPPKPAPKPDTPKPAAKPTETEAQRVTAILSGKTSSNASAPASGKFVIFIGAFSNPNNVAQLKTKFNEIGIKTYTEPLDAPDGRKTRVRAGPFESRAAAEKALEKIKRIGVNGEIRTQQ